MYARSRVMQIDLGLCASCLSSSSFPCRRHNSPEFGKYVTEVKLKKVKKVTKRKVREEVLVKVKRKKMVKGKSQVEFPMWEAV